MSSTVLFTVQHIRKMRGGTQAHLMRASDGNYYVVKFQNCPHHPRVLVNEFLATKIALFLALPMPEVQVIDVPEFVIMSTPELRIETAGRYFPCSSGLQLALRYAGDIWQNQVVDYMPEALSGRVENLTDLIQVLVFDKWVGNCDRRQAVFSKLRDARLYRMTCIDQGWCFNAAEWTFPDKQLHGTYCHHSVYSSVNGWDSFEPVLSKIEQFDPVDLGRFASQIPPEWYEGDSESLYRLVETLYDRRRMIRNLIISFHKCSSKPFVNWKSRDAG